MRTWKINMKNGSYYLVQSDIENSKEFIEYIFGKYVRNINISHFKLTKPIEYIQDEVKFKSNCIAIVSTDVSSVEWLSN